MQSMATHASSKNAVFATLTAQTFINLIFSLQKVEKFMKNQSCMRLHVLKWQILVF